MTQPPQKSTTSGAHPAKDQKSVLKVPPKIAEQYPDLEELISKTESMTDEERTYWFQIMPIMTDEQIQKLRGILIHEKEQLTKLDAEYETELAKLNEKHLLEWKTEEMRQKRKELQQSEQSAEEQEKAAEESLLAKLSADV